MAALPVLALLALAAAPAPTTLSSAELLDGLGPRGLSALRYRHIGPFRGGRTKAATGVPGRPGVFFIAPVNGGIFQSDDYGRTWTPIFDDQDTASIGALAVAPNNPDILYAGSGEGMQRPDLSTGDGLYRSLDGGRTWAHLGLRDGQQIPQIAVDPQDASKLFIAVLGHPYGPNEERGLYRSLDGGETVQKVLGAGPDVGAADVAIDPQDPRNVLAALWESRQGPWENAEFTGPGSGLFKSTDGGTTWRRITKGLPGEPEGLSRIGVSYAPSRPSRVFATVMAEKQGGLYRSDDGGETWARVTQDERVTERGDDFAEVKVHPTDPDTVFTASIVAWKSTDGGRTFTALRGAPGGDDYQKVWIDPGRPEVMLLASDQGAVVTVNGGRTWSSWYNQPTAQLYHVTADDSFPYRLCGGQQESGSACVQSRGVDGRITFREWHPAGFDEYGYAAPDPKDPDVVFGGRVTRWDRRTSQAQDVGPEPLRPEGYRILRTMPVVFSPADPRTLFHAANRLYRTRDGGQHWDVISPDLSRPSWDVPASVGKYRGTEQAKPEQRGVIYAVGPSPLDAQLIWAGTDDGLIHLTRDGGAHWANVTPPQLTPWAKVSFVEPSHTAPGTAWAAINTLRLDDLRPHVLRTRDFGATWEETVAGLPVGASVNVVREDPVRPGLLFAATERAVFVSLDAGTSWASLRLNLPNTSVRDLIVKDADLAIATHGRGFWILDDLTALRRLTVESLAASLSLLGPAQAVRVRLSSNGDTPLPPDEPAGENPPEGALIHYTLRARVDGLLTLRVLDESGRLVRTFRSDDPRATPSDVGNVPRYWLRAAAPLSRERGLHRFVWDLHEEPLAADEPRYPMAAVPHETAAEPRGPWALPGRYTVELIAGEGSTAVTVTSLLTVTMDPRVKTAPEELRAQHTLSRRLAEALAKNHAAAAQLGPLKEKHELARALLGSAVARRDRKASHAQDLGAARAHLLRLYDLAQQADSPPTPQVTQA
ncbi:MAG: glycoside hydrolase, partial [Deltaproteobacteria bacterium]|nr:glycoside hydrolase [Deltaproteobacteria bacterium]